MLRVDDRHPVINHLVSERRSIVNRLRSEILFRPSTHRKAR
jgi:hypothetical protein